MTLVPRYYYSQIKLLGNKPQKLTFLRDFRFSCQSHESQNRLSSASRDGILLRMHANGPARVEAHARAG